MHLPPRIAAALALTAVLGAGLLVTPAAAQTARRPLESVVPAESLQDAPTTREDLRRVLALYPNTLGRILKLDPQLMSNETYLAPYPALAEFLKRHPEIPRNPTYFLSFIDAWGNYQDPVPAEQQTRREAINLFRGTFENIIFFCVFLTILLTVAGLVRYVVSHRRWVRASKTQSDVHGRLMERLSTNEELLAYVQSPAGSQFLKGTQVAEPMPASHGLTGITAPFGRILWSVQAGLVLACGGIGLLIIRGYVIPEVGEMLLTMGVLAISLGVGFALASAASYVISRRLGLIEPRSSAGRDLSA